MKTICAPILVLTAACAAGPQTRAPAAASRTAEACTPGCCDDVPGCCEDSAASSPDRAQPGAAAGCCTPGDGCCDARDA